MTAADDFTPDPSWSPGACMSCGAVAIYATEIIHAGDVRWLQKLRWGHNGEMPRISEPPKCPHCGTPLGANGRAFGNVSWNWRRVPGVAD